jgi:asparagine synthase (glutamine-hydrolysing)
MREAQVVSAALADNANTEVDFSLFENTKGRFNSDYAATMTLASSECLDRYDTVCKRFIHPWLRSARRSSPGSLGLLAGLMSVTSACYHSAFAGPDEPSRVSPLASQPIVEWSLRTPAHLHIAGAQNRAVARSAFSDVLSDAVISRGTAKGGPELWLRDVMNNNLAFLREFLLDGHLVKARLIDRKKLELNLSRRMITSKVIVTDIFAKLYMEAWLHQWHLVGVQ